MSSEPVLVDGPAVAEALGVTPALIRKWASRGLLTRHGRDSKGRILYDLAEAYQAQAKIQRQQARAGQLREPRTIRCTEVADL